LRDRIEDLLPLVEHFIAKVHETNPGHHVHRFSPELFNRLASYAWPGNVRELENIVKRLVIYGLHEVADVDDVVLHAPTMKDSSGPLESAKRNLATLRQFEEEYIAWIIAHCGGNKTRAAEILDIDASTIHRRGKMAGK
jgi:two-component system, NtrC family, response regulator HydG